MTRIAMMCVQNAGRSQMATAYAEREREARGLEEIELISGGTNPADTIHDEVVEAMAEDGFDLTDSTPQAVSEAPLAACDIVVTMGCSTLELDADTDIRDWDLTDPHGQDIDTVHEIRREVRERVNALFDELEQR